MSYFSAGQPSRTAIISEGEDGFANTTTIHQGAGEDSIPINQCAFSNVKLKLVFASFYVGFPGVLASMAMLPNCFEQA